MIIIGVPLYLYHWHVIKKDKEVYKDKKSPLVEIFYFGIGFKPGGKVPRKKERMETLSSKDERG